MGILLTKTTKVLVQGITGREGSMRAKFMRRLGTNVVAGVTPGRGGEDVDGIPVYNTVREAVKNHGLFDVSVTFIPGTALKDAVFESLEAEIKLIVMPVERVPLYDILEMVAFGQEKKAMLLGPGSIGINSPGIGALGWLGGSVEFASRHFVPGHVGVISRSGGQSGTLPYVIAASGFGVSTVLHVGTEPVVGMSFADVLPFYQEDPDTDVMAIFGEMGGSHEEEAAELVQRGKFTKPIIIYVSGAWAPAGMKFSHASAIVERGSGSTQDKIQHLRNAGIIVVDNPNEIPAKLKEFHQQGILRVKSH
jgi:succinyl-CoA synthetase alpha subunit